MPRDTSNHESNKISIDAYNQGANAFLAGNPRDDNPFAVGTDDHDNWNEAWDCEQELASMFGGADDPDALAG